MITFTILLVVALVVIGLAILVLGAVGATGIVLFGDLAICALIIVGIVKLITRKKRR